MNILLFWALVTPISFVTSFTSCIVVGPFLPTRSNGSVVASNPWVRRSPLFDTTTPSSSEQPIASPPSTPPTILNGKRVIPATIIKAGLKGQQSPSRNTNSKLAAVYALLSSDYQKGTEGWSAVIHVGVSQDLYATLQALDKASSDENNNNNQNGIAYKHVRALSFSFPQPNAMQDVADDWKQKALDAGAVLKPNVVDASMFLFDDEDDDDDDDDDDDWSMEMVAQAVATIPGKVGPTKIFNDDDKDDIISPFEQQVNPNLTEAKSAAPVPKASPTQTGSMTLSTQTVDLVLNEVRPYLIADGGNVAVKSVDESTQTVYLELEGACGSCPSSTVTMQMGIERVLKENFGPDVKVEQVAGDDSNKPKSLSYQMVEDEIKRIQPAITAMGGVVRIVAVDADTGAVQLQFRGASRVQQGLELALRDLPFVNAVQFVSGGD